MADNENSERCKNQLMVESIEKLYLDSSSADVHFSFNSGDGNGATRIGAHKNLLGSASDVFKAMLYGGLKETGDINVVDATDAAFKEFLQYFYLGEVKLTQENIAGVIHLGNKYNVKQCVEDCIQFLVNKLNAENVCAALSIAMLYDRPELRKACEIFITVNTGAVFESNGFPDSDKAVLAHILTTINVFSCSEADVFEACMAWVQAKSKQKTLTKALVKKHLGDLYYEIRYASMTMKDLLNLSEKYNSVLEGDFRKITQVIVEPEAASDPFNKSLRQAIWNDNEIVKCDRTVGDKRKWYIPNGHCDTTFSTNKPLLLGKFTCNKMGLTHPDGRNLRSDLSVDVQLTEATDLKGENSKILLTMKTKLRTEETTVVLPHPVLIRPGYFYTICVERIPDKHCYLSKEFKTEAQSELGLLIKFHRYKRDIKSNKPIGLISVLNFNRF